MTYNGDSGDYCDSSDTDNYCDRSDTGDYCDSSDTGDYCDSGDTGNCCDNGNTGDLPHSQASSVVCSSVCIQYNTRKWKSAKTGKAWEHPITWMTSGGRGLT